MGRAPRVVLAFAALSIAPIVTGCGAADAEALSRREFVAAADRICLETADRFETELPEPVGGAKPVGLGAFMRRWVARLRTLVPPTDVAKDWDAGLDLLIEASHKLDDAENGDPDAQGEALFVLEAQAGEHFDAMHMPFKVCFVE
jgi:hypothetical protein